MTSRRSMTERRTRVATALLMALAIAGGLCWLRRTPAFSEQVELPVYDLMTMAGWPWQTEHPDVVLVTLQATSIPGPRPLKWPLSDANLRDSLLAILDGEPTVIGIDLLAEPNPPVIPDGTSWNSEDLRALFQSHGNIVASFSRPASDTIDFPPPPFALGLPPDEAQLRIASANFPTDGTRHQTIRRGYFSIGFRDAADPSGQEITRFSLAALCAIHHTHALPGERGISVEDIEGNTALESRSGGYVLDDRHGLGHQFLLKPGPELNRNLCAASANLPLHEVLQMTREQRQAAFRGKVVLLGTNDSTGGEDRKPVTGNPDLRGIKLQALATAQLLREHLDGEPPIRTLPDFWEDLLVIAISLAGSAAMLGGLAGASWRSPVILVAIATVALGGGTGALRAGYWIPAGAPAIAGVLSGIATLAQLTSAARRANEEARLLFARRFGSGLADRLWDHRKLILSGGRIPTESFEGTILFSDLAGYTPATRQLEASEDPAAFSKWIGGYMQAMIGAVIDHGGLVKDVEGDAIMAVFGFPPDGNDSHAANAVACALAMCRAIVGLNARQSEGAPAYRTRVGIYTGTVTAVQQGSLRRFEYALIGNAVNCAKRLEQFRKEDFSASGDPVRILAGSTTRTIAPDAACYSPVSELPVVIDAGVDPEIIWILQKKS